MHRQSQIHLTPVPVQKTQSPVSLNPGTKSSRKPLPAELPPGRHIAFCLLKPVCPACGGVLKEMGETISEQLDIINTAFKVIETIRPKLACSRCDVIVQAPLPPNRSNAVMPVQGYLHGSWSANIWNISLYIASRNIRATGRGAEP